MDKLKSLTSKLSKGGAYFTPFNLVLVAIFITVLYAISIAFGNWSTLRKLDQAAPGHRVQVTEAPANLTVTLFYDYRCPFCFQIDPIIRAAAEKDGEIELLFKFLPSLGESSEYLARVAFAAGRQDKFLQVHDYIMQGGSRDYNEEELRFMSEALGLNYERLKNDIDSQAAKDKVQSNMDLALSLGAYATPTILAGNEFYVPENKMPDEAAFQEFFNKARRNL